MERLSHRRERVGRVLMRALAQVLAENNFHLASMIITLSSVKMSADLRVAHIYFRHILLESEKEIGQEDVTRFLKSRTNIIRRRLASLVHLKFLPELRFHYDEELGGAHTPAFLERLAP